MGVSDTPTPPSSYRGTMVTKGVREFQLVTPYGESTKHVNDPHSLLWRANGLYYRIITKYGGVRRFLGIYGPYSKIFFASVTCWPLWFWTRWSGLQTHGKHLPIEFPHHLESFFIYFRGIYERSIFRDVSSICPHLLSKWPLESPDVVQSANNNSDWKEFQVNEGKAWWPIGNWKN